MRAVVITQPGGPEVLRLEEVPDPLPGPGEVLVEVAAAGLNRADVLQRQGHYPPPPGTPPYPGMECSGRIIELGPEVTGWQVGDEVCALLGGGAYAEKVAVPQGQLLPVPERVSLVDAAALPEATCTIQGTVYQMAHLAPARRTWCTAGPAVSGRSRSRSPRPRDARWPCTAGRRRSWPVAGNSGPTWPSLTGTTTSRPPCRTSPAAAAPTSSSTSWVPRTWPGTSPRWPPGDAWRSSPCGAAAVARSIWG